MTPQDLLKKYNIPYQNWGTGTAKTFDHFLEELELGEAKLIEQNNQLFRVVRSVVIEVYYKEDEVLYKLFEDRQEYTTGRIVRRNVTSSIMEKLKPNEEPKAGAVRGLKEELSITLAEENLIQKGQSLETIEGKSYPGLINQATIFFFEVFLEPKDYNPKGYKEIQAEKTNFFVWKIVSPALTGEPD